jgi:quinolinate synthase
MSFIPRSDPRVLQRRTATVLHAAAAEAEPAPGLSAAADASFPTVSMTHLAAKLTNASDATARSRLLLELASSLSAPPQDLRQDANRVMGCTAQVWLSATLGAAGDVVLCIDSDSQLTKGLGALLVQGLAGLTPQQLLEVDPSCLLSLGLGDNVLTRSRTNGFLNMLEAAKRRARFLLGDLPRFPSLVVTRNGTEPQGAFAEAQDQYLRPDSATVDALVSLLERKKIGIVAHFYMDPQVQGVLMSAAQRWPHIKISDSLVMADGAVKMVEAGCRAITVLGVDFMSENVRAILDEAGHGDVAVYRMASESIGCSLAEAAESSAYESYLAEASTVPSSLHVVYINTSLKTKALAHQAVPTITCTSSNVVQTVLQAFAQVPDARVWYGPDTYMGRNLAQLFASLAAEGTPEEVAALHPDHTPETVRALLPRLRYFEDGACIVHHLFGGRVCELVREAYRDAYIAAHFEVPGEMFTLAMEARRRGMGVVGSTQNILDFIAARLAEALRRPFPDKLQFVLGTEVGMVTSIVRKVQGMMNDAGRDDVAVEIVFPVSQDAITTDKQSMSSGLAVEMPGGLQILPGAASGEGCSMEGGCASCPYMKMNSLTALMRVCERVGDDAAEATLEGYKPRPYAQRMVDGKTMAQAGCVPILHMRGFQRSGKLPEDLVGDMQARICK